MDDDDFDIDLDDVEDEELAKMVQDIKTKSAAGALEVNHNFFNLFLRISKNTLSFLIYKNNFERLV